MKTTSLKMKAAQVRDQFFRYKNAMQWLWREAYGSYKLISVGSAALMFMALVLKFGALAILARYLHLLAANQNVHILGYVFENTRTSFPLLIVITALALGMFVLSSVMQYFSEIYNLRLCINFEERCSSRALFLIATVGEHAGLSRFRPHFSRISNMDVRYCGTAARLILRCLLPLSSGLVALAVLLYLDARLTISLFLLVLLIIPLLYRASLKGARHSKEFELRAPQAVAEKRRLVSEIAEASGQGEGDAPDVDAAFRHGPLRQSMDAYLGRLVASAESTFLASVLMAVAIFALLFQKGTELLQMNTGWGQLTTYLLVLRLCLNNFTQITGLLASFNRIYPQMFRFISFERAASLLVERGVVAPAAKDIWVANKKGATAVDELLDEDV
jgi:ABC-type multidrug transport system fused ATPase/permease subunit